MIRYDKKKDNQKILETLHRTEKLKIMEKVFGLKVRIVVDNIAHST